MENQNKEKPPEKNVEALMAIEWEIINKLQDKLKDQDLTTHEYTATARALALHINNLIKLYDKSQGVTDYDGQNLGEYVISSWEGSSQRRRIYDRRRDRRGWQRRITFRR